MQRRLSEQQIKDAISDRTGFEWDGLSIQSMNESDLLGIAEAIKEAEHKEGVSFQDNVGDWLHRCFDTTLYTNMQERGDRLLEEVLELLQANGYDKSRVATLVDYVYGREVGVPFQEAGGVAVTFAAYCQVAGIDMEAAAESELIRINKPEVLEKIQKKQEAKRSIHFDTPLPGDAGQE